MSPLTNWGAASVLLSASGTAVTPLERQPSTLLSSPAQVKILACFRSSTERTGRLEKRCTQPPYPQLSITKPLPSSRAASVSVSLSRT